MKKLILRRWQRLKHIFTPMPKIVKGSYLEWREMLERETKK